MDGMCFVAQPDRGKHGKQQPAGLMGCDMKRKRNNELLRTKRVAAACLKNCAVLYVGGDKVKHLVSLKHRAKVQATPNIDRAVHAIRWRWTVLIAAFCRDQAGQEYIKMEELAPAGEYLYSELADSFNDLHFAMINEQINKTHLCSVGWLAVPRNETIDENLAGDLFRKFGAFEYLANWEHETNE